jgi:hypothetical protein
MELAGGTDCLEDIQFGGNCILDYIGEAEDLVSGKILTFLKVTLWKAARWTGTGRWETSEHRLSDAQTRWSSRTTQRPAQPDQSSPAGEDAAKATLNINILRKKEKYNSIVMIITIHCRKYIKFAKKFPRDRNDR